MPVSDYEVVIGLEVHCQLDTRTKMFSACGYEIGAPPNTRTDPYTWGLPGTLPVPNRAAVDYALRLAVALGCEIQPVSRWARKHYFYPDLPKGYQITQSDQPYALGGALEIPVDGGGSKRVHLQRIHLEEDAGKNTHDASDTHSLVDYNRAGAPLVEIVSLPELRSAAEAAAYMRELRTLVRYLGISQANMEEGTLRCDANVSLRPVGSEALGTRCEIKNLNSFKFLEAAILAEVRRQVDLLERGEVVVQSTLSYDPSRDRTKVMRSKEEAADYRYFPEPDMPPLQIDAAWIAEVRANLPELPWERYRRFLGLGLSDYDAGVLCAERELGDYFDQAFARARGIANEGDEPAPAAKPLCNWITQELLALLNAEGLSIASCPVSPEALAEIVDLISTQTISGRAAKAVLATVFEEGLPPVEIVERDGHRQVSDLGAIIAMVREVMDEHPAQLEQLLAGKDKVRGFFVGQVMRRSSGQANPQLVQQAIDHLLGERAQ
ncbi:Asp-tRNA(Asn)/Glu-tRNA(Gln) amidotransferase subunit GatB [Pseudenhygromyxa sp. WMMC2535]|uniref:Asp-tRNA(Asn)/Glu-tRNA(Gln) amidotransferase subunit GatB n=1 Tax=Pseudenhygromyxa sp. WMMC2535 TaxID=2712867 RepID=UPI00155450D4|nr:Asp-tRNA(Asn)/Glu-tRNA(Gln) amidotransferase subunit GatB [Pseudenhygromyxa sp. WMMC2535]NVB39141.1 Asp-tRNA(Asn)/Glu-tRNA(Gln) amidotransferase subunit GatB [Pseudenhygromyxa sp. WMMC2535]